MDSSKQGMENQLEQRTTKTEKRQQHNQTFHKLYIQKGKQSNTLEFRIITSYASDAWPK